MTGQNRHTRVLGIDPGLSGGYALVGSDTRLIAAGHFPQHLTKKNGKQSTQLDAASLASTLQALDAHIAFVEAVSSRPRQAGQWQFGFNTGLLHGILHAHHVPVEKVAPASWKAAFGIKRQEDERKSAKKSEARMLAIKWFPDHAHYFSRVKDDGVAEAALIALYGIYALAQR